MVCNFWSIYQRPLLIMGRQNRCWVLLSVLCNAKCAPVDLQPCSCSGTPTLCILWYNNNFLIALFARGLPLSYEYTIFHHELFPITPHPEDFRSQLLSLFPGHWVYSRQTTIVVSVIQWYHYFMQKCGISWIFPLVSFDFITASFEFHWGHVFFLLNAPLFTTKPLVLAV